MEASALVIDRAMHSGCQIPQGQKIFGWYQRCAPNQVQAAPGYRFKGYGYQGGLSAHPPTVEQLSNMQTALNFMLMQPKDDGFEGGIAMFPAWPCDWDVSFKLHAPKGTIVEGRCVNGACSMRKQAFRDCVASVGSTPPARAPAVTRRAQRRTKAGSRRCCG